MQNLIPVKAVDTDVYMEIVKELLEEGKEVPLLIAGNSMSPFLVHQRDTILISRAGQELKKGDMAFYQRSTGQYVMHRICRVRNENGEKVYYFAGDAQTAVEGPISRAQIFGVITAVCRKGKWQKQGCFWWEFFRCIWVRVIPMRKMFLNFYGAFRKQLYKIHKND